MPNWCSNHVTFKGERDILKKVENFCQGMDFNKIKPMPVKLNIVSGTFSYIAEKLFNGQPLDESDTFHLNKLPVIGDVSKDKPYGESSKDLSYLWTTKKIEGGITKEKIANVDCDQMPKCKADVYELGRIMKKNKEEHEAKDWLDWRYKNWGTKWNASYVSCLNEGEALKYSFDTPGSPPYKIIEYILTYAKSLGDIEMKWNYKIEMMCSGTIELIDAGLRDKAYPNAFDYYDKKPKLKGIVMFIFVHKDEFINAPQNTGDEITKERKFSSKEEIKSYIKVLGLKNEDFIKRLLSYVEEYDVECDYVEYEGIEGLSKVEPVEYVFSLRSIFDYN